MDSKVCVFLLVALLGVALALAGSIAGGSMEAVLAGKRQYGAAQLMMTPVTATPTSVLGVEVRRRVLGSISPSSLDPNRAACIGSCPAAGGAYTGRGCQRVYQCSTG
ncbi:hypothetical protein PAHAL_7G112200 [Panicum hallii]|uniref:Uncharacterized protein n=1 Tax=Panicum hallii TaxID=206008 RepID=A0A2T8IBU5_9POAL|nr:uncharacterized protein LOC112900623 [Panicum hallii]PVH35151.1 hypothetical protein PAHAL_7G112200 [Panicum hallii]